MLWRRRGHAARQDALVWLLGNGHPSADRSVGWDEDFGNLSDPDMLIDDLTALAAPVLQRINKYKLDQAQMSIRDKLFHGGTIVVITQPEFSTLSSLLLASRPDDPFGGGPLRDSYKYSNYHVVPAFVSTRKTPAGSEIRAVDEHPFKEYIDAVEGFDFLISVDSNKLPTGPTGAREARLCRVPGWDVADNSGHRLGFALAPLDLDRRRNPQGAPGPGRPVLLPPPTEPIDNAIGKILSVYKGAAPFAEAPPAWADQISPERAEQVQAQIEQLEGRRGEIDGQIADLRQQKSEILGYRRLLYAKGPNLKDAVGLTFRALGFAEIDRHGGRDAGDLVFDASANGYQRAVVEVKGADKRTGQRHMVQCNKWADDLVERGGASVKGVFIANQHRVLEYPRPIEDRRFFEPNELDYAAKKDMCVIPTCNLYEAVKKVLGGAVPDRNAIAQKITGARGGGGCCAMSSRAVPEPVPCAGALRRAPQGHAYCRILRQVRPLDGRRTRIAARRVAPRWLYPAREPPARPSADSCMPGTTLVHSSPARAQAARRGDGTEAARN